MDGIQLSLGYRATKNKQFTFNNLVLREIHGTHFIDLDRLKRWVDLRPLDWEPSTLPTRVLLTHLQRLTLSMQPLAKCG